MRKISEMKLRQILAWKDRKGYGIRKIAKKMKFSARHMRRVIKDLEKHGIEMLNRKYGRKEKEILEEQLDLIINFYLQYKVGATVLEKLIYKKLGVHIPHNRIHKILKEENLVMELSKKRKNYNWVRYERSEPNELWHTDWCEIDFRGKRMHLIAFIDDYSRFIVGYGLFDHATSENAVFVLRDCISLHGKPKAVMSDKGTQFYSCEKEGYEKGKTAFEEFLEANEIEQVLSRVKHPQSNGKIERFFGTVKQKLHMFSDIHDFMDWYNNVKPHMSLDLNTPSDRYLRRI